MLLSTFNCCGLLANLYIHWLKTKAIVYELLYFDMFQGADKRVWQLLKDFKNDKELHYVTIKSKTLICHFNLNTPGRPFVSPSIHPSLLGTKWPKWVRNDQKRVRNDLGTNWPPYSHFVLSWPRYEMTKMGTKWPKWVRNDLGTKWLLLGTKWPKGRYEMTKVGTKWPGYEMTATKSQARFEIICLMVGNASHETK